MIKINISLKLEKIINNLNNKRTDEALKELKILSSEYPDENLVNKLFASIYFKKMDWDNAIKFYKKILPFEKEKFKIYTNIGVAYFNLGKITKSIKAYEKAIENDSKFDLAYSNLGISYLEIGMYEDATNNFISALRLNKKNFYAQKNLINIFNLVKSKSINKHPLIDINNKISKIVDHHRYINLNKIENIKKILYESEAIIESFDNNLFTTETQIYRKNSKNLNCKRHFKVFNEFNIIPKFCFSCYKIQINLKNVVDLIKLYFVFDNLYLENNNIRKCIVEIRDNISGNYKGYIYCNGLIEAQQILEIISEKLLASHLREPKVIIKHGCSEFYKLHPRYEKINFKGEQEMSYDQDWETKEKIIDNKNTIRLDIDEKIWGTSIRGLNLSDILIIKNWINYADSIGDYSYKLIYEKDVKNNFLKNILQPQLNFRKKDLLD